ncbi:MAG: GNAT family N-acetyltransferase [Breznakia sp.]
MSLSLHPVSEDDEQAIMEYRSIFIEHHDSLDGTAGLQEYDDFGLWYQQVKKDEMMIEKANDRVMATTFLAKKAGKLVGFVNVRHELNDALKQVGGHIGYSVLPRERGKGYAKEMLRLGLLHCKALNIKEVLLTCQEDNIASNKVILFNRGILQDTITVENAASRINRYWVSIV